MWSSQSSQLTTSEAGSNARSCVKHQIDERSWLFFVSLITFSRIVTRYVCTFLNLFCVVTCITLFWSCHTEKSYGTVFTLNETRAEQG